MNLKKKEWWMSENEWYFVLCMSSNEREGQKERHSAPAFVIHPIGSSTEVLFHALCYYILSARVCKLRLLSEAKREWPWFWRSRNRRSTSSAGGRLKKERGGGGQPCRPTNERVMNGLSTEGQQTKKKGSLRARPCPSTHASKLHLLRPHSR